MFRLLVLCFLMAAAAGCDNTANCDTTATQCPYNMYGTAAGNCLYGSPVWFECDDPHSICQGAKCTANTNNTCTYGGSTIPSKFCCGSSTSVGSLDCPSNQTYDGKLGLFCGTTCQRPGSECDNGGRTGAIGGVCNPTTQPGTCPDGHPCADAGHICCKQADGSYLCLLPGLCT